MERDYEITFLLSSKEEISRNSIEAIKSIFEEFNAKENKFEDLGVKATYFPIKKNNSGRYVVYYISLDPTLVNKFSKAFTLIETILRHIIIELDRKSVTFLEKRSQRKSDKVV